MDDKIISQAVISRLPRYLRYLKDLERQGINRISSQELSELMKVTASQIRQDLNNFGGFGQQGYGYNVDTLIDGISNILGLEKEHRLIIIGAGNLGRALINYSNYQEKGFHFCGIFDKDEKFYGMKVGELHVLPMEKMEDFIKKENIDIAVIAIPKNGAREVAQRVVEAGIRAIWNFANVDYDLPDDVVVESVHLSDSLMKLSYKLNLFS